MKNFKEELTKIKAFAFDCDGVLTDGLVTMTERGELIRVFNAKDGYAMVKAFKSGYPVAIVSGGHGATLERRFRALGLTDIYLKCAYKVDSLKDFCARHGLTLDEVLFMGDDMPDIAPMSAVGLAVAPSDAVLEVKAISHHVSEYGGGRGCVRDIIEQVMKAQGKWATIDHFCQ